MGTAYTPQQIVDLVKHGSGSGGMFAGGGTSSQLSALHQDIANEMRQLQGSMGEYWQGDAAGQAYTGAGPLVQASQVSGQHLQQAQNLYQGQGDSFNTLHAKVQSVGDIGDKPAGDWVSGTPLSFLSNRQDEIDDWNRKAQAVTESYDAYHQQSTDNSSRWADPSQYGQLAMPSAGGDFTITQPGGTGTAHLPTHYTPGGPGGTGSTYSEGGYTGNTGDNSTGSNTSHRDHTNDLTGPPGVTPPSDTHPWGPGNPPTGNPPETPGRHVPPHTTVPDDTRTSSYVPPDLTGTNNPYHPGNPNTWSPNTSSPNGGGSSNLYGPGFQGDLGGGRGGSAGGNGGSNAGNPGNNAGRGTGTGTFGNSEAARGAAAGANGRAGASGMGAGAMGRGQKGEGEEDLVHETADYLVEQDPDAALIGDLPKAVPPVIGL